MTDLFDAPGALDAGIPRDGWGRPKIIPPGGGKPVAYTRCTTFVDALEDKHALTQWKMRQVAIGLSERQDLLLSVSAHRDDRDQLNKITGQAMEAAASSAAATTGTALHTLTERHDLGQPIGKLPPQARADLDAYIRVTEGMRFAAVEQFRVEDELKIGGTLDRLLDFGDRYVIGDVKTGDITYGIGKICMQLAVYAHAKVYDPATGERYEDDKPMDLERGLVIHLPAGEATCTLHWVDLTAGWEAVQLAAQVRKWRGRRGLSSPAQPPTTETTLAQIAAITDIEQLRDLWRDLDARNLAGIEFVNACKARAAQLLAG